MTDNKQPDNEEKVVVNDPAASHPPNPEDSYEGRNISQTLMVLSKPLKRQMRYMLTHAKKKICLQVVRMLVI